MMPSRFTPVEHLNRVNAAPHSDVDLRREIVDEMFQMLKKEKENLVRVMCGEVYGAIQAVPPERQSDQLMTSSCLNVVAILLLPV